MRVLCLSDAFWPDHTGGISKSLLTKVEGLLKLGHDLTVVCRRLDGSHPHLEDRGGYRIYRYSSPSRGSALYRLYPLSSMYVLPRLLRHVCQAHVFDVAYTNDPFQVAGLRRGCPQLPYVHNYHASAVREIKLDASKGKYSALSLSPVLAAATRSIAAIERRGLVNANSIIVDSRFMGDDLRKRYHEVNEGIIRQVALAVDTERFAPARDRDSVRRLLGLPTERPILLTVRRLVARTGIDSLITAMSRVIRKFPDVLLCIGGSGYLRDHLERTILNLNLEHNVRLLGFIPEGLLPAHYQAADLFVLPTLDYEGFGLATIESLACGTPVLGTPVGATPEILGPLGSEFLFRDATDESIARGINSWLGSTRDPGLRQRCRVYCVSRFDKPGISRRIEHVLAEAAGIDTPAPCQHGGSSSQQEVTRDGS